MSGEEAKIFCEESACYIKQGSCGQKCDSCYVNINKSTYTRKCFMTGEYCSKQTRIQREREELHKEYNINAFVVMSFSNMTDVVYEWRIKPFIEKLKVYLAFDKDGIKMCCSKNILKDETEDLVRCLKDETETKYHRVREIYVERADTDIASNYVMCSRVCQRMQVADLVIVDVSNQNPNVFYELGLAIALGKLILPICFSESYHKMNVPQMIKETDNKYKMIEHHIGSFPWRKALFEYYGIFQKQSEEALMDKDDNDNQKTHYMRYENAINIQFGFSDIQYSRFPYDAVIIKKKEKIGEKLYNELRDSYNNATKEDNTLLVYTMDGFLNAEEAGICIVNFYHMITSTLQEELCFCGDRVGVLVQGNGILEADRDSDKQIDLFYSVGEIIHIGVNQATYLAEEEKLKADDVITSRKVDICEDGENRKDKITKKQRDEILSAVKGYIRNRGMIIYPNNPVYVKRELDRFAYTDAECILEDKSVLQKINMKKEKPICNCTSKKVKTLYHKTLHALRYVNEVVIDISNNSIHALFWLGIAHGSSVNAIMVSHEATEKEREKITDSKDKKVRTVFDVAGLWTAILHSNDSQGFYRQLAQAQYGIENHAKLILKDRDVHRKKLHDAWSTFGEKFEHKDLKDIYDEEKTEIIRKLESYYRSRFWNAMLRHNQLLICMSQIEQSVGKNDETRGYTSKWDFRASALLSHYLSKRTVISEYKIEALTGEDPVDNIEQINFISLGSDAKPLGKSLSQYIIECGKYKGEIHEPYEGPHTCMLGEEKYNKSVYKGFKKNCVEKENLDIKGEGYYTQHPHFSCCNNEEGRCEMKLSIDTDDCIAKTVSELKECTCKLYGTSEHIEIAQFLVWRDSSENFHEKTVFRVAINGSSGPATLALSSILVGEDQKKELFHTKADEKKESDKFQTNLLYNLQANIRAKFMEKYEKRLKDEIEIILNEKNTQESSNDNKDYEENQKTRYKELVWYAVSIYLYNELYRYFLPLISDKDMYSLYNGMHNFVNHMRIENESPFSIEYPNNGDSMFQTSIRDKHITKVINVIPDVLLSLLKELQGVEAFYKIRVKHDLIQNVLGSKMDRQKEEGNNQSEIKLDKEKKQDSRMVESIELLEKNTYLNCFWK